MSDRKFKIKINLLLFILNNKANFEKKKKTSIS